MSGKQREIDIELLKKLNEAIKYSGIKPAEIARQIGIRETNLSDYKYFRAMPSLTTFKQICKIIDADANEILGLK